MNLWLPGAEKITGPHARGLTMDGTKGHYCTHHITVTPKGSYDGVKAVLLREGFEPTLLVDPVAGKVGQFLPGNKGGFALEHPSGGPTTNTEGTVHVQIEWVWPAMWRRLHPSLDITRAPHFDRLWHDVIVWLDQLDVPRTWPFGFHSTSRDVGKWRTSGHRGHVNAPSNSHVDNLPAARQPAWPVVTYPLTETHQAEVGDLTDTFTRRVAGRRPFTAADRSHVTDLVEAANAALNVK